MCFDKLALKSPWYLVSRQKNIVVSGIPTPSYLYAGAVFEEGAGPWDWAKNDHELLTHCPVLACVASPCVSSTITRYFLHTHTHTLGGFSSGCVWLM
mgnify:CR=1 FL=1